MIKALLLAMIPFLLAGMNHYFRHKEQREEEKAHEKRQERRQEVRREEKVYDHKWEDS